MNDPQWRRLSRLVVRWLNLATAVIVVSTAVVMTTAGDDSIGMASTGPGIAQWRLLSSGDQRAGPFNAFVPMRRYGAALDCWDEHPTEKQEAIGCLLTMGYAFDHSRHKAVWPRDSWRLTISASAQHSVTWERTLFAGAANATRGVYHHTLTAIAANRFLTYGGDDGGGPDARSHVWGSYTNQLVAITVRSPSWWESGVTTEAVAVDLVSALPSRQGHSATAVHLAGIPYVLFLGGSSPTLGAAAATKTAETWDGWLVSESSIVAPVAEPVPAPGPRRSHTATCWSRAEGVPQVVVFGGFHGTVTRDDVWMGELRMTPSGPLMRWRQASPSGGPLTRAVRRGGHAAVVHGPWLMVALGADCTTRGCRCQEALMAFNLEQEFWREVLQPAPRPVPRYYASGAAWGSSLIVFGGESYHPYAYWNDVWLLTLVAPDTLASRTDELTQPSATGEMLRTLDDDEAARSHRAPADCRAACLLLGATVAAAWAFLFNRRRGRFRFRL